MRQLKAEEIDELPQLDEGETTWIITEDKDIYDPAIVYRLSKIEGKIQKTWIGPLPQRANKIK